MESPDISELMEYPNEDLAVAKEVLVQVMDGALEPHKVAAFLVPSLILIATGSMQNSKSPMVDGSEQYMDKLGDLLYLAMSDYIPALLEAVGVPEDELDDCFTDSISQINRLASSIVMITHEVCDLDDSQLVDELYKDLMGKIVQSQQNN